MNETDNLLRERVYQNTLTIMKNANDEMAFKSAADSFESLGDYKEAPKLYEKCVEQAKIYHNDSVYAAAKAAIDSNLAESYEDANKLRQQISLLQTILGWKDSEALIEECRHKIEVIKEKEEEFLREAQKKAEAKRVAAAKAAKLRRIVLSLFTVVVVAAAGWLLLDKVALTPDRAYDAAMAHLEKGEIIEAYDELIILGGHKDSEEQAAAIYEEYKAQLLLTAEVGETVLFGEFPMEPENQDPQPEAIEWIVLERKEDGSVLLLSLYGLQGSAFHKEAAEVSWANSQIRSLLNDTFAEMAFDEEELQQLQAVSVPAGVNDEYETDQGADTQDRVFLLSIEEAEKYLTSEMYKCVPTRYAISTRTYMNYDIGYCGWWLRSMGENQLKAVSVDAFGIVHKDGTMVQFDNFALRPAIWVKPVQ